MRRAAALSLLLLAGCQASPRSAKSAAASCKGRGFCPSCLGRRMPATAANLMERVLPETGLRQWVRTFPSCARAL